MDLPYGGSAEILIKVELCLSTYKTAGLTDPSTAMTCNQWYLQQPVLLCELKVLLKAVPGSCTALCSLPASAVRLPTSHPGLLYPDTQHPIKRQHTHRVTLAGKQAAGGYASQVQHCKLNNCPPPIITLVDTIPPQTRRLQAPLLRGMALLCKDCSARA